MQLKEGLSNTDNQQGLEGVLIFGKSCQINTQHNESMKLVFSILAIKCMASHLHKDQNQIPHEEHQHMNSYL